MNITFYFSGKKGSGQFAYFTAGFPFLALVVLFCIAFTLPGKWDGLKFFFWPREGWFGIYKAWTDPEVWYAAVTQSLFSMSIGSGTLPKMGSKNNFRQNIHRDALIIVIADTGMSLLAGKKITKISPSFYTGASLWADMGTGPLPHQVLALLAKPRRALEWREH